MLLARHDGLTGQSFAAHMGLEKTWASRLLAGMEEAGLIRRLANPADGRSHLLELTAKGRAEQRKLSEGLNDHARQLLHCVPAAERAKVEHALEILRDALNSCLTRCRPGECGDKT